MRHVPRLALAAAVCFSLATSSALASTMYRYKDDNGRMVISNTVPSESSTRGYEILNTQGRVVDVVEPAPTAEEIAAREAEKKRKAQAEKQREEDAELLRTFSHPNDAVRALHRKLQELDSLVQLKRGNISVIESQLEEQQSKAADLERAGREVPENLTTRIERLHAQIREIEKEIAVQNMETQAIRATYEQKIERLEAITGENRTLSLEPQTKTPTQEARRAD
ncbi:hypothetical protein RE428_06950 [Marinobacter nanhaiticus D15-8W]|uniref:DUF4124 domain-containing protein n=1 Tax=Marinobacter nanhaiticus D15-8W TaxID=626887 RepID=N6WT07_9GAMM|nr:DUF4124 domain-containing protein [Marinobacter nanhaiticus]ENO14636.2 DUF4124 domain-containing protein [Marinobacter nanhaiticus D15-8W]BES69677.1 hypothetical protein RE428_06950 [Marinobacter nanhaiticus D15-8W]